MKYLLIGFGIAVLLLVVIADQTQSPKAVIVSETEDTIVEVADVTDNGGTQIPLPLPVVTERSIVEDVAVVHTAPDVRFGSSSTAVDLSLREAIDPLLDVVSTGEQYKVLRVIDGDTIEVETSRGPKRVRYIGVNTPETVHPSQPVECMGKEASAYNKQLVEGKFVTLVRDVSDTDRYGRWLRYVYVDGVFVNEVLVANGFANVVTYPPDVKYTEQLRRVEQDAREARRGLWGSECEVWVAPTAPPTSPPPTHHVVPNTSCVVKGNINSKGEKIFHVPGCQSYEKTVINEAAGEQWFCSESEALAAGWRRALNCQ